MITIKRGSSGAGFCISFVCRYIWRIVCRRLVSFGLGILLLLLLMLPTVFLKMGRGMESGVHNTYIYKIAGCKKKGKIFKWKHSVIYLFQFKWKWSHMQMIFGMSVLAHVLSFISYLFPFILLQKVFCFLWSSLTFTTTRFWFERAHNLTHKCATLNRIYVYYRENIHIPFPHRIVPTARYTRNTNNSQQSRWILLSIISFIMWCIHKCVV